MAGGGTGAAMQGRSFLDLSDAGGDAIAAMIGDAQTRKAARFDSSGGWPKGRADADAPLAGHVLGMIFEKNSTRTRVSFDIAMRQLGGSALILDAATTQLGRGESIADTARVLSRMVDAIMIRTDDHAKAQALAEHATVPVINGLTDRSHPCQIVADLLTVIEHGKPLPGLELAWLGDGNNVLHSLLEAAALMKFDIRVGAPEGYDPQDEFLAMARDAGCRVTVTRDAAEAARGADVVVTDTWVSMGQEHAEAKLAAMAPFQVDAALMALARPDARFLHCLPAHVGEEVSQEVFEGPQSLVFDEAENRIHAQKSILLWCHGKLSTG
ncbi:ornithine carbamoyltransferase [Qipengyuania sp. DY56-A-20]|jgi:ornithine carbamoyltransferase|uniref:Ornithine carbamoyltransferase n=1 Tax=Qipengyuania benthica TaxID=3067651 RepID=A0ABT9HBH2_9SPHN|nr:ornithine carbamoyltransferase [Qipengyuania sp. DY56-A-20]MDP4540677.1 ornithine carbamoyltransferase [Qipengyuania sp. DY56-A-20]